MEKLPYQQGALLVTPQTERFNTVERESARRIEARRIFSGFTSIDNGRSRKFVAECKDAETAAFIVSACNLHDKLLADLVECGTQRQRAVMDLLKAREDNAKLVKLLRTAEAALALQAPDIGTTASTTKIMAMGEIAHVLNAIDF